MTDRPKTTDGRFAPRTTRTPLAEPEVGGDSQQASSPATNPPTTPHSSRPMRRPVGSGDRLRFPPRPGYYRRVVNDDPQNPGRIQMFLDAGYEFVQGDATGGPQQSGDPSKMSTRVSKQVGGGVVGYLMEQPMAYREEDLALKHQKIEESEADMRRSLTGAAGRYGKVSINEKTEEVNPV